MGLSGRSRKQTVPTSMKGVVLPHKESLYAKVVYWFKLVALTGGAQVVVQGAGLLTGILIIRLLPTREYAYYTLANTVLGMMTMLSDAGISSGVMAQGGKVWQDRTALGVVLASGLNLRKKFALLALAIGVPMLVFLMHRNGADWLTTSLVIVMLIPSFLAALSDTLLEVSPKLHQQIGPLQRNQTEVSVLRLFLSGVSLFVLPFTAVALLINGATRIYGNQKLRVISSAYADKDAQPDPQVQQEIVRVVKRILPPMLYYCFSSQIIIWIPSILGNTEGVAQVGALSRLAMALNMFSILISTLLLPRFARIDEKNPVGVTKLFVYIQFILFVISLFIIAIFYTFPTQFLWILGNSYANLSHELVLMIVANCIGMVSNLTAKTIGSRGWFVHPAIVMGINISSIVIAFYAFNLSHISGVLYYDIFLNAVSYVFSLSYGFFRMKKSSIASA